MSNKERKQALLRRAKSAIEFLLTNPSDEDCIEFKAINGISPNEHLSHQDTIVRWAGVNLNQAARLIRLSKKNKIKDD